MRSHLHIDGPNTRELNEIHQESCIDETKEIIWKSDKEEKAGRENEREHPARLAMGVRPERLVS